MFTNLSNKTLIILLSVAVGGILVLQGYWVRHALVVKEQQFDRQVVEAMQRVADRMRVMDAVDFVGQKMNLEDRPYGISNSDVHVYLDSTSDKWQMLYPGNFSYQTTRTDSSGRLFFRGESGRGQKMGEFRYYIPPGQAMDARLRQLDTLMQVWLMEEMKAFVPIEERFKQEDIDSLIKDELRTSGVDAEFQYAFFDGNRLTDLRTTSFDPSWDGFRFPVFRGDLVSSPQFLVMYFPGKVNYLFMKLGWILFLSILFVALIVFIFYKTLQQFNRQKRISQVKSDFINNMTHEFKTPIATINLATEALSNSSIRMDSGKMDHYTNIIRQENRRMNEQVEKVLQMSLFDKQEVQLDQESLSVNALLNDAASHFVLQVESRGGELRIDPLDEDVEILGDPVHLENVIGNLLDNGFKYSPERPILSISATLQGQEVEIQVSDKGIGMSKEAQKQIFDRFYRVPTGNRHDVKGQGLGLSYARDMIAAHHGSIRVKSEPGKGTTFIVRLPIQTTDHAESHSPGRG
ncbi:MAG: HAMP domain-containing histidine kinase [Bacteroidota bacterium]|nr:HAMP domain-containing histidine kinase [Bacteroidota bacterium]